jgi:hypothetical protein
MLRAAYGINNAGKAVGSNNGVPVSDGVPESSTWAMLVVGFAGLPFEINPSSLAWIDTA